MGASVVGIELYRLGVICDCVVKILSGAIRNGTIVQGTAIFGVELDHLGVIRDSAIKLLLGEMGTRATGVCGGIIGIKHDCRGVVGYRVVLVPLGGIRDCAIVEGRGLRGSKLYRFGKICDCAIEVLHVVIGKASPLQ